MSIEQTLERIAGALESINTLLISRSQQNVPYRYVQPSVRDSLVPLSHEGAMAFEAVGGSVWVRTETGCALLPIGVTHVAVDLPLFANLSELNGTAHPEVQETAVAAPPPETAVKTGSWAEPAVPIPTPAVAPETPQVQAPPPAPEKRTPRQPRKVVEAAAPPPAAAEPAAPPPAAAEPAAPPPAAQEPAKVQPLTDLVRNADVPLSATRPAMIGIDTLRTRGARLSAIGLRSELVDMLAKRGAVKFGDLKPEEYPGVWDDMDTIQNAYEDDVRKQGGMPK